jgi:hypothetical protein
MAIEADQTMYVTGARTITITRVPNKALVRVQIKGAQGDWGGISITAWGDHAKLPEIIETTGDEPPVVLVEAAEEA